MFKRLCLFTILTLPLALISLTMPAHAQKKVSIEIKNISRNDAQAKKTPDGNSILVPIQFQFVCNGTDAGRFFDIEAVVETVNTDGARSRVSKRIADGTSNTLREERIGILLPEGVFAREFKLTIRGKWRVGNAANLIEVSEVKTGSFHVPANVGNRKQ
jgi:hypothetical protein